MTSRSKKEARLSTDETYRLAAFIELHRRMPESALQRHLLELADGREHVSAEEITPRLLRAHAGDPCTTSWDLAEALQRRGANVVTCIEAGYPERIRLLRGDKTPPLLYYQGDLQHLQPLAVGLIGMRRPSLHGLNCARSYAAALAAASVPVVSGNAPGIDSAAHEEALRAGGVTIVFPPSALDQYVPKFPMAGPEHNVLVMSPFLPGSATLPWYFLHRNMLVAAHAGTCIVAETGARGGTHHTIKIARQYARPVLVSCLPAGSLHGRTHATLVASGCISTPARCDPPTLATVLRQARAPIKLPSDLSKDLFQGETP